MLPALKHRTLFLLRWSERCIKTDMAYLAAGGFWLTTEQIFLGLMALGVSVGFAHLVSAEAYGTYRFLLSLFWTLAAFSLTGLPTALIRAVARGEDGAYRQALPLALLGALPMSAVAAGIAIYYFTAGNTVLGFGAVIIGIAAPFFQTAYLFGSYLEGKRDFRQTAISGVFLNFLPSALLLALMPFTRSPLSFLFTYLGGSITAAAIFSYVAWRTHPPQGSRSQELTGLGLHMSFINIIGTVATQADQLLIFHFVGPAGLAAYSFATSLPDQLRSMVSNLSNLAFPQFARRGASELSSSMGRRILLLTFALAVAIAVYILIAPLFFRILFPAYQYAVGYSDLYAVTLLASASLLPSTALSAQAAKRELYLFNIISAIVQLATLVAGAAYLGLLGVIAARGASRLFNFILASALFSSYVKRASS